MAIPIKGRTLKYLRTTQGYTVREVARLVSLSPTYVSLVENEKKRLTEKMLNKLLDVYNVQSNEFKEVI